MKRRALVYTAFAFMTVLVLVHPLWYMPSLRSLPQASKTIPAGRHDDAAQILQARLHGVEPEHFDVFFDDAGIAYGDGVQIKDLLESAGWKCDRMTSAPAREQLWDLEIVAPADSAAANVIYDWARSTGYRVHFEFSHRKLAIIAGRTHMARN